jgi:LAO/AO transport system kinase
MVDFFLLLMLAGAGDELQGIKKGIMEMADALVITKADGDNITKASEARAEYNHALHLFPPSESGWITQVHTCSATMNTGIVEVWNMVEKFSHQTKASGFFTENRRRQRLAWFHDCFDNFLTHDLSRFTSLQQAKNSLEQLVANQQLSAQAAAYQLMEHYYRAIRSEK